MSSQTRKRLSPETEARIAAALQRGIQQISMGLINIRHPNYFWWVRGSGPDGDDLVLMLFKGRHHRSNDEGRAGDVKCRPASLDGGEYTVTVGYMDCKTLSGKYFTRTYPQWKERE
jgi:hypothetical protein